MRRIAYSIRLILILHLFPIGTSRAQDVFNQAPQPGPSAQDSGYENEPPQPESSPDEELIVDPELNALAPTQQTGIGTTSIGESCPPPGQVKVLLRSRFATDLEWEEREEVWEANQLFLIETNLRTSESLRFSAGIRVRHQFAALEADTTEAESTRFEFDAIPTAGYADATLTEGLHLRAGFQMIQLGPTNVFSATNFLSATDLRNGPTTMPEAAEIAQLALRVDADPVSWLSFRMFYLPFYQSHLISTTESDYAQYPASRVEEVFVRFFGEPGSFGAEETDEMRRYIKKTISRSSRSDLMDSGNVVFLPEADLSTPQGALRIALHGFQGELGLTAGSSIERFPSSYMPPDTIDLILTSGSAENVEGEAEPAFNADDPSGEIFYNRFYVFAIDATTDVGPIQLGVEASYQLDRTLLSVQRDFWPRNLTYFEALLQPGAWPIPGKTDIMQFSLHGEFLEGSEWVVALEGVFSYSIYIPYEPGREWLSLHQGRYFFGGAALVRWMPLDGDLTVEVSSVVANGLNYLVAPRFEFRLISELYAELGVYLVGSSAPSGSYIDQEILTGYLYEGIDQAFVGLRWLP